MTQTDPLPQTDKLRPTLNITLPKAWRFPHANDWTIFCLPQALLENHNIVMTGFIIKADKEGWLVMVKGVRNGEHLVSYSGGSHWEDAVEVLCYEAAHGTMTFKPDRYANR